MEEPAETEPSQPTEAETEVSATAATTVFEEYLSGKQRLKRFMKCYWHSFFTVLTPLLLLPLIIYERKDTRCLYTYLIISIFWATQAIPIPVTGLLPVLLYPALAVSKVNDICIEYQREAGINFLATALLAYSVDKSGLYKRMALKCLMKSGHSHLKLTLSVFLITALGSMFFTDIVTTEMTLPIVIVMLRSLEEAGLSRFAEEEPEEGERPIPTRTTLCYLIGIAYSANIGSTATIIGSGVNLSARTLVNLHNHYYMPYQMWCMVCLFGAVVEVIIVWLWLNVSLMGLFWEKRSDPEVISLRDEGKEEDLISQVQQSFEDQYNEMGSIKGGEIICAMLVIIGLLLWIFRSPIYFSGWEEGIQKFISPLDTIKTPSATIIMDASITTLLAFILAISPVTMDYWFFCTRPNKTRPTKPAGALIDWKPFAKKINWYTYVTIGGGFALYRGILDSKLLDFVNISFMKDLDDSIILILFCLITIVMVQFVHGLPVFFIVAPFAAHASDLAQLKEFHIIVAVAVCCSMTFLYPWTSETCKTVNEKVKIPIKDMVVAGLMPLLFCYLITVGMFMSVGKLMLKDPLGGNITK